MMNRGQVLLAAVEAGIGVLLLRTLALGFAMGVTPADTTSPQLEACTHDAAMILQNEQPRHQGQTRLAELTRSASAFDRERDAIRRRTERLLPDNVLYRIETRHGTVTIRVWYV